METQNTTTVTGASQTLATNGLSETYNYDSFGNGQSTGTYNFVQAYTTANQLSGWSYDQAGNLLYDGMGNNYQYDAEGQIKTGAGVTYYYDAEGQRVGKSGPAVDTIYFAGRPIARLTGTAWTDLIYGPAGLLAEVPGTQAAAPSYYRMTDHLGSLVGTLAPSTGAVVTTQDVAPFGEIFTSTGASSDPYQFTGKERDTESGLDYFGARYYASNMGRFLSPDWSASPLDIPYADLENPQTLNLYSYVNNNPLSKVDKDGHEIDLTGTDKDKQLELQRLAANASKTDKNGLSESSLFKETTDKSGKTTLTLDKDAAASFKGDHSAGYNLLTGAIDAKPTISIGLSDKDSFTSAPDSHGNVSVNLNRNVSPIDAISPLRGFTGQPIPNPFSIIAGHETLGHAYPRIMGWPSDEKSARQVENQLRREQGLPLRDPNSN